VGVVSDGLWQKFCAAFDLHELAVDPHLATNVQRVQARERLLPLVRELFSRYDKADLLQRLERTGLPFAPIGRPEDLFDDPHLQAGGLIDVILPGGQRTSLPAIPLEMAGERPRRDGGLPKPGEHSLEVMRELGIDDAEIARLIADQVVA
jgi:crotonobetainyl-CoA:carnitine CoA-transferase CaiB-like acyl-CoA transferase